MQRILSLLFIIASLALAQEILPNALLTTNVARYRAAGTLNIACTGVNRTSAIYGINSNLTNLATNASAGIYNGSFVASDGSFTRLVQSLNTSTTPGYLANFLGVALRNSGNGALSRIVFLTRYDTVGGVLPVTNCTADNNGTVFSIPFEASYGFYRAAAPPTDVTFATLKTSARAIGNLQYTCTAGTWVGPSNINSTLYNLEETTPVGSYNGSFTSSDGSVTSVIGGSATSYNIAPGAALAYFLARATPVTGNLTFNNVSYIARYDTVGGVIQAIDGVCNSTNEGTIISKPFAASYNFYTATNTTMSSSSVSGSSSVSASSSISGSSSSSVSGSSTRVSTTTAANSDASICTLSLALIATFVGLY